MKSEEETFPIGTKVEFERNLDFGMCEQCGSVGKMFKCAGQWVCFDCACELAGLRSSRAEKHAGNH